MYSYRTHLSVPYKRRSRREGFRRTNVGGALAAHRGEHQANVTRQSGDITHTTSQQGSERLGGQW